MRKNKMMRLASGLLVAVLLTTCVISGTFAKYTSSATGTSEAARVAKWQFTVEGADITKVNTFDFDVFETIVDTVDGNADDDVDNSARIIAPGTKGNFAIDLVNLSEVNATYTIAFSATEDNAGIPIEYSLTGEDDTWVTDVADLSITNATDIAMANAGDTDQDTVTIYWRWAFVGGDSENYTTAQTDLTDTALGVDAQTAAAQIVVTAVVTVTQVD